MFGQYVLKIGDQVIGNDGIFTLQLPDAGKVPLQVFTSEGKLVQEIPFELDDPMTPSDLQIPKTIRKDYVEKITGDFLGDISEADLLINQKPADVIAGNDTELYFETDDVEPGKQDISFVYDDMATTETVNVVDYSIETGSLDLNRGDYTYIDVTIVGLDDLQETLELEVQNQSPGVVNIEGGKSVLTFRV